jgi:hypothetical protein
MVIGPATAAVQVAVIIVAGDDERWTEGSLAVQLALTNAAVFAVHGALLPPNKDEELKAWPLPGAAAVWSALAVPGVTFKPTTWHPDPPPQPMVSSSITAKPTPTKTFNVSIVRLLVAARCCC